MPSVTAGQYREAMTLRIELQQAYTRHFSDLQVSALLLPTCVLPPCDMPPQGQEETVVLLGKTLPLFPTYIRNTDPGACAGLPGLSLPAGLDQNGLPAGLELDGPMFGDEAILNIGAAMESVLGRLGVVDA